MKQKLSVSLDEKLLKVIDELVNTGRFRNKSHFVEYSLNVVIKNEHVKEKQSEILEESGGEDA